MKTINSFSSKLLALTLALMASVSTFASDDHSRFLCCTILTDSTVAITGQSEYKTVPRYEYLPENLVIPAEVTLQGKTYKVVSIDQWAFYACTMLKSVIIPHTVTFIGMSAFHYCENLVEVYIPSSVKVVEGSAFAYTKWFDNLPDGEVYINNTLYRYKGTAPENTKIVVKDGTTRIAGLTFWNQSNIVSIELPQSLTVIEQCAFERCTQLSSILIPKNVIFIGANAFADCTGLSTMTCIAPTPPTMGQFANPSANSEIFARVDVSNATLYVPAESVEAYKNADQWKDFGQILPIEQTPEDLFPTLWGLQRTEVEYHTDGADAPSLVSFEEYTPTFVNGKWYLYDGRNYLREENNQVLLYSPEFEIYEDVVLYDWTLEIGDTLPFTIRPFDDDKMRGAVFRVTDVATITLLDGKEYKKWTLACGIEYIEGIGAINGEGFGNYFCIQHTAHPATYIDTRLVCARKNGQLLYQMDDAEMEQLETECLCEIEPKWSETWCNQWNILSHGYLGPQDPLAGARTSIYWLSNNTVNRNGQEYIPLMCSSSKPDVESTHLVGELRFTEDKQVYFYYAFDETEYLLYDFGAELGDTLELFAGLEFYNYHKTYTHVITDKETLDDGRLQIQADVVIRIDNGAGEYFEEKHPVTWIEGLGSTYGIIFNPSNPGVAGDGAIIMLCAYRDDECVYTTNFSDYKNMGCVYNNDGTVDEDLFPMLAGLQRTVCNEFCGDTEDDNSSNTTYKQTFDKILFERDQPYIYCNSAFLLREENNKILIYSHSLDKDLVLYDFTLEVGDSLPQLYLDEEAKKDIYWIYYEYMNVVDYNKYNDSIYPADTLIVTDVSMITLLDGKEYKKWTFDNGMEYVEGIGMYGGRRGGNFFGLIQEVVVPCHTGTHLVCVSKNGQLLYKMDDAEMERLGAECLCEAENPEDLFPTLWGLQQTICSGYYGEEGDEWASGLTGPSQEITMMDGKPYLQWGSWYLREENDKILVYSEIQKKDLVLYDFTLELGDTLTTLNLVTPEFLEYEGIVGIVDYPLSDYDYTYPIDTLVVTELSKETLLDGKEYTRWKFSDGTVYVEGIGSMSETFFHHIADHLPVPVSYLGSYLVCVSKNNKLLYQMDPVKMDELGAECLCDYDRGPRKDNAKDGQIGGRPTPTQWNQLELDLREMENGTTILRAETFSYTLEDISQQVNNKTYFQLARQSTKDTATTKSFVGALHFGKDEDNRVYFLRDGVEYVLYDFTAEIGDTVEIFAGINNYPQETTYTHVVVDKDTTEDGACRMFLEVVFPDDTNATAENAEKVWLAGLGSVDGIVHNAAKRTSNAHAAPSRTAHSSDTQTSVMLCAWREDSCLYTTDHPDYNDIGCIYNQDPTAIEDTHSPSPMTDYQKLLRNGQLLIIHKGKTYNVLGVQIK